MAVGLMPFLQTCGAPRQLRVRSLARRPAPLSLLAGALGALPTPLVRAMIRFQDRRMDDASVAATAALLRRDVALVALTMGASEFELLDSEAAWGVLADVVASGRCDATPVEFASLPHPWLLKHVWLRLPVVLMPDKFRYHYRTGFTSLVCNNDSKSAELYP